MRTIDPVRFCLAAVLALLMAVRAPLAPMVNGGAPGDGWIPICSGGILDYVYVGDGAPASPEPGDEDHRQICPIVGFADALTAPVTTFLSASLAAEPAPPASDAVAPPSTPRAFRSRAPP